VLLCVSVSAASLFLSCFLFLSVSPPKQKNDKSSETKKIPNFDHFLKVTIFNDVFKDKGLKSLRTMMKQKFSPIKLVVVALHLKFVEGMIGKKYLFLFFKK